MKLVQKRIFVVLFFIVLVSTPSRVYVEGADTEDYDNYIAITVYPDESIVVTLKGSHSDSSPFEQSPAQQAAGPFEELSLLLNITTEQDLTTIANVLHIKLDPSDYASLANLDLDLEGHSSETSTNLTALIDYPGYLGVDGSLGFVIVEPPYGFILDLDLEAKLYYSYYPREELSMMVGMLPLLETQLSSQIMNASDGNIILERLELQGYEEAPDHASFRVRLSLSGDLQKGLHYALESMGAELTPEEAPEEPYPLSVESYDYHIAFSGDTLVLEADSGGTVAGDLNGQLNRLKDEYLGQLLESEELEERDRALVTGALPIDLYVNDLHIELAATFEEDSLASTFTVAGLGLGPSSFAELLALLEELSGRGSLEEFKLVLEGGTSGNQYVVFTVPADTKAPVVEEEQRVVWDMDDIENLEAVTYEVKTKQLDTTTIVVASAAGLAVIGVAGYFLMRRKVG